ncbi:MAG: YeeE/YedE family protein [Bacteroidota bacterium]
MEILTAPWPWYVAGPVIGLTVPLLLILGNKRLGISSTLRHICAACVPASIPLFKYDWKSEIWSFYFVGGVLLGGVLGGVVFANTEVVDISQSTVAFLQTLGVPHENGLMPRSLFDWNMLFTAKGFLLMIVGGFMVGFGTRWARGCTSGHGITGLSALQWPSLLATMSFFLGGIVFANFVLPFILSL